VSKHRRAYKIRFCPTDEQKTILAQTFGCVRFVYNWGLNTCSTADKTGVKLRLHGWSQSGVGDREPWHLLARGQYPHGYAPVLRLKKGAFCASTDEGSPTSPTAPQQNGNSGLPVVISSDSPALNLSNARKIERASQRDHVGEAIHEGNPTKCSFFGLIEVPVRDMRDAGVLKVECPECLAMRGLASQGETVRFPSHDLRKTRTPNRETRRWVRREGAWELASAT